MATWHNTESAREGWIGAPLDDGVLQELLNVSRAEVVAYAPAVPDAVPPAEQVIPDGYRWAHLEHARNIWNARNTDSRGSYGSEEGGFQLVAFPMDWAIKARLRPRRIFGGPVG